MHTVNPGTLSRLGEEGTRGGGSGGNRGKRRKQTRQRDPEEKQDGQQNLVLTGAFPCAYPQRTQGCRERPCTQVSWSRAQEGGRWLGPGTSLWVVSLPRRTRSTNGINTVINGWKVRTREGTRWSCFAEGRGVPLHRGQCLVQGNRGKLLQLEKCHQGRANTPPMAGMGTES